MSFICPSLIKNTSVSRPSNLSLRSSRFIGPQEHDPMSLAAQLQEYIAACFTGLWIESHEHDDALAEIARLCHQESWRLAVWDVDQGLKFFGKEPVTMEAGATDPLAAIRALGAIGRAKKFNIAGARELPSVSRFCRDRAGPRPADQHRQTNPHVHRGAVAGRADSHRTGKTVRGPGARVTEPRAARGDCAGNCHSGGRTPQR